MSEQTGWSEANSQTFVDYGKYFVPEREMQIDTLVGLVADPGRPFTALELCCGEGLLAQALLARFPHCTVVGLDGSPLMLQRAAQRLVDYGERFRGQLFDLAASDWREPQTAGGVHAVLSSLAIHHLDGEQKAALFADVYHMLAPGGTFLVADLIRPESALGMACAADAYDAAVRQRAVQIDGDERMFEFFVKEQWNFFRYPDDPLDRPSSLLAQLHWLKQAGFREVDTYWMRAGHAIFGGYKPV